MNHEQNAFIEVKSQDEEKKIAKSLGTTIRFPLRWHKLDVYGSFGVWVLKNNTQCNVSKYKPWMLGEQLDFDKLIPLATIESQVEASMKNALMYNNGKQQNIRRVLLLNGIDPITLQLTKTFINFSGIETITNCIDEKLFFWWYNYFHHHNHSYALNYFVYAKIAYDMHVKFIRCDSLKDKVRKFTKSLLLLSLRILHWIEIQMLKLLVDECKNDHDCKFYCKVKIPQCEMCFFKANIENIRQNILFALNKREESNTTKYSFDEGERLHFGIEYFLTQQAINFASGNYHCDQSYCIETALCNRKQKTQISLVYWTNILWHVCDWLNYLCVAKRYHKASSVCHILIQHWLDLTSKIANNSIMMKKIEAINNKNISRISCLFSLIAEISLLTNDWVMFEKSEFLLNHDWDSLKYNSRHRSPADSFDELVDEMFAKYFDYDNYDTYPLFKMTPCDIAQKYYVSKWKTINIDVYKNLDCNYNHNCNYNIGQSKENQSIDFNLFLKMNAAYLKTANTARYRSNTDYHFMNSILKHEDNVLKCNSNTFNNNNNNDNEYNQIESHTANQCNVYNFKTNIYPYIKSSLNIMPLNSHMLIFISKIVLVYLNDYDHSLYYLRCAKFVSNILYQFQTCDNSKLELEKSLKMTILHLMKKIWFAMNRLGYSQRKLICCNSLCNKQTMFFQHPICSGCHAVQYCSRKCQKQDWKTRHRKMCLKRFARRELEKMNHDERRCLQNLEKTLKRLLLTIG